MYVCMSGPGAWPRKDPWRPLRFTCLSYSCHYYFKVLLETGSQAYTRTYIWLAAQVSNVHICIPHTKPSQVNFQRLDEAVTETEDELQALIVESNDRYEVWIGLEKAKVLDKSERLYAEELSNLRCEGREKYLYGRKNKFRFHGNLKVRAAYIHTYIHTYVCIYIL